MKKALREGFTTGTAAAAASAAAVTVLLGEPPPVSVSVPLPPFVVRDTLVDWSENERLLVPIAQTAVPAGISRSFQAGADKAPGSGVNEETEATGDFASSFVSFRSASAAVIKDGGDDPDATDGMNIIVHASFRPFSFSHVPEPSPGPEKEGGTGFLPLFVRRYPNPVFLYAGPGIGRVTLPGLPVPPGEPAINPEPRRQIAAAACEAAARNSYDGAIFLYISAPEGEERAKHTLNERLGITGGISILGTRGTVRPYSHEAWKSAIEQGIRVAHASACSALLLSTGRRGERALQGLYPSLPACAGIQVADFAAFSLRAASAMPCSLIAWGCFAGKLLKLAQGLEWTHARSAAADISLLAELWRQQGGAEGVANDIAAMPTASGAFSVMREASQAQHDAVLSSLAGMAGNVLLHWLLAERESLAAAHPLPQLVVHVFSLEGKPLLTHEVRAFSM